MGAQCPHLDYRREAGEQSFDHERAYCTVVEAFVQPMRADVCNARHDLAPAAHCEFYRDAEGLGPTEGLDPDEWDGDESGATGGTGVTGER